MMRYRAFVKGVEVNRNTISSVIKALPAGEELRESILCKNEICLNEEAPFWYSQQKWLNCFEDIENIFGEMMLFFIGISIPITANFPPYKNLKDALIKLDIAYHLNHRLNGKIMYDNSTGEMLEGIGHYTLDYYNQKEGVAIMICNNPYPSLFDQGIIDKLARKALKYEYTHLKVYLDETKETRKKGGKTCTYIIEFAT